MPDSVSPSNELALDLLWFFDQARDAKVRDWERVDSSFLFREEHSVDNLNAKFPFALSFILKEKDSPQVIEWQAKIRELMKELGFYSGKFQERPKDLLKKLAEEVNIAKEPSGPATKVLVYTNPWPRGPRNEHLQIGSKEWYKKYEEARNDYIKTESGTARSIIARSIMARAIYAIEANARKREGGIVCIELVPAEMLEGFWKKMRKEAANRRIISLEFYDHGESDIQNVDDDYLDADSQEGHIPREFIPFLISNADIVLNGCNTFGNRYKRPIGQSGLATNLGNRLLLKGGTVKGFYGDVNLAFDFKNRKRLPTKLNPKSFQILPIKGQEITQEVITKMESLKGKLKVKQIDTPKKKSEENEPPATLSKYPDEYPDEYPVGYPDSAYYT